MADDRQTFTLRPGTRTRHSALEQLLAWFDRLEDDNLQQLEDALLLDAVECGWSCHDVADHLASARAVWRSSRADLIARARHVFNEVVRH